MFIKCFKDIELESHSKCICRMRISIFHFKGGISISMKAIKGMKNKIIEGSINDIPN